MTAGQAKLHLVALASVFAVGVLSACGDASGVEPACATQDPESPTFDPDFRCEDTPQD